MHSVPFCVCKGQEVQVCLSGRNRYTRCGIWLRVEDFHPGDRVTLCALEGVGSTCRTLACQGQALFGFLPPGPYGLMLERGGRAMQLFLRLPPGGNVELCCSLGRGECRWRRGWCRCFLNLP